MANFDKQTTRKFWLVALAVIASICVIYSCLWLAVATSKREQVVTWIKEQSDHSMNFRYEKILISGFPFAIHLEVKKPALSVFNTFLPMDWQAESIRIITQPLDSSRLQVEVSGQQVLMLNKKKEIQKFTGDLKKVLANLMFSDGQIKKVILELLDVQLLNDIQANSVIRIPRAELVLSKLERTKGDHQTGSWSIFASTEDCILPLFKDSPLSKKIQLTLKARTIGNIASGHLVKSLENWRDNGGTVELEKLKIGHGPLKIHTEGTLALDNKMQPIGALTAHLEGIHETIDALKKLGIVEASKAITAKLLVGVLSRPTVVGGPPVLNLAITAQNRNLYVGPVQLLQLPEVIWY